MKRIAFFLLLGLAALACNQNPKAGSADKAETKKIVSASIEELVASPHEYRDMEVAFEGMVTHVCRHGGQKCFVVGSDGETQIRLVPAGDIDEFRIELEGSTLAVKGTLRILAPEEAEAHVEDHESKAHHAVEQSHSEAEKAEIFVEVSEFRESND